MQASSPDLVRLEPGTDSSRSSLDSDEYLKEGGSSDAVGAATEGEVDGAPRSPTKRAKLRGLGHKAKEKTRRLLSVNDAKLLGGDEEAVRSVRSDPAFNPGYLRDTQAKSKRESVGITLAGLGSIGKSLVHPVDAIKRKATKTTAGELSKVQRPFLSKQADVEFLEAHDNLDRAKSTSTSRQTTSDEDRDSVIEEHRDKVEKLQAQRESLRVAWTTTRFVTRVRVVPKRHFDFPDRKAFLNDVNDKKLWARSDWLKWIGHILVWYTQDFSAQYIDEFDELPYDLNMIRHHVERIIFASAPWQAWLMDVRSVYRWENPLTTLKWFVTYVVLWQTDHIIGFLYAYILYIVLKSRFYSTSIDSLRTSMQRAHNRHQSAYRLGELVDKHGNENWIEPLMEEMGPYIQLQLGDVANMLEVLVNFYNWMWPRKTVATLWFFVACLLVSLFCDMAFCVKITGFVAGGSFFLCWPIASIWPQYRYLVSPFKWALWDIPTDAEWSFEYLRRRAQINREEIIKGKVEESHLHEVENPRVGIYAGQTFTMPKVTLEVTPPNDDNSDDDDVSWHSADSSSSVLDGSDIIAFRARSEKHIGRFIVYANGVRFVRSLNKQELWRRTFLDLAEMRKLSASVALRVTPKSLEQLELVFIDGSSIVVGAMKDRDEAFNTIIGFSALQWQSLQYSPGAPGQGRGHRQSIT